MNWKHTKSLLLILLIGVNVFLFFLAHDYYNENNFTSTETASRAAEILKESGINVSADQLSTHNDYADILSCEYDREQYLCAVSALLFGKEADGIYLLPNGIRAQTHEGEVALINYDLSLDFVASELRGKGEVLKSITHVLDEKDSSEEKKLLEKLLALPNGSLDGARCVQAGVYTFITVNQVENGMPLFGMDCVFGLKGEKIVYANGKHFFAVPEKEDSDAQILNRINILFSEKDRGITGSVTSITFCYTLYEDEGSNKMLFIPSYSVTYSNGSINAINALDKVLY